MSLKYIRDYYKVPAFRGHRVFFCGRVGKITASEGPYLRVQFPDKKRPSIIHPTFNVQYLGK